MTMDELLGHLALLQDQMDEHGIEPKDLTVSPFLLGPGIHLEVHQIFIDGETLHLDLKEKP